MSDITSELSNGGGGKSKESWTDNEELRRARILAFRARRQRNCSLSSISSVSDVSDVSNGRYARRGSAPEWDHINRVLYARRGSAPERDHINRVLLARRGSAPERDHINGVLLAHKSTEALAHNDWGNSSLDIDQLQPYDMAKHILEGMPVRKPSLPTSELRWGESTITMDATTSLGSTGPRRKFKIILLGDCGVGKSSFLQTLLSGKYSEPTSNTNMMTSNSVRTVMHNGQEVELNFFDTAGQEKYRSMTSSYYRYAQGSLVFFNVNYRQTFDHVELWLDDLKKYGNRDNMAVLLVGLTHRHTPKNRQENNKEGSYENTQSRSTRSWSELDASAKRAVPRAEVEHLASNCYLPYMEADIKSDPDAVLRTVDKLLDLLLYRGLVGDDGSQNEFIVPKSKRRSECCS